MTPSTTKQPATVPTFGTVKRFRTSARPIVFSLSVGARRPSMAARTSFTAS
jgi:hypothetical protein